MIPAYSFKYADLFAGIGGFAATLEAFGGEHVYAVEVNREAARVYERNWGYSPLGDIELDANDSNVSVPAHDILAAGFPCQPFSKSGAQRGMEETRGTLFWHILKIIQVHRPLILLLENVRNLAGPRHRNDWALIMSNLRDAGYRVSTVPAVFSPHLLPKDLGGRPQVRERIFITATYDPEQVLSHTDVPPPGFVLTKSSRGYEWDLINDLPLERAAADRKYTLTSEESRWVDAWDEFVQTIWSEERQRTPSGRDPKLPGFPIWSDEWVHSDALTIPPGTPPWKETILRKNSDFYTRHRQILDSWLARHRLHTFPASRRKLEWQAQTSPTLWECALQFRPSGIRAKRLTHLPALVAMNQGSIIGPLRRRLTPVEAARLQGLPDNFSFGDQPDSQTYKQLGNGVSVGAVWHVLKQHVKRDEEILKTTHRGQAILKAVLTDAPLSPDQVLADVVARGQDRYQKRHEAQNRQNSKVSQDLAS